MKDIVTNLNKIFDKSNSTLLRFYISFFLVLIPFLCVSILVLIAVYNYLRAVVLALILIGSFFERTRDNKYITLFIGIIPLGFYVATSPIFVGYILGIQTLNIGSILWDNKFITIFSGVSIYGIIKVAKGTSSIYEWFVNTGIGGYFFPEYKQLKDHLKIKDQAITQMVKNHNDLLSLYEDVKVAKERWKTIAIGFYDKLMTQPNSPSLPQIEAAPNEKDVQALLPPVVIAIQQDRSLEIIEEQMMHELQKDEEDTNEQHIIEEKLIQKQLTTQQQSTAIIPISDATITAVQKVLTGGGILLGIEVLSKVIGTDSSYLLHGYDLLKQTLGPYMLPAAAYVTGEIVVKTTNIAKKTVITVASAYRETQKLVVKGIMNIAENATSTNVPNISMSSQEEIKIKKPKPPKQIYTITYSELLKLPSEKPSMSGIQDVPLIRKPGYRDFIELKASTSNKPLLRPRNKSLMSVPITLNKEQIKSITWSLPD